MFITITIIKYKISNDMKYLFKQINKNAIFQSAPAAVKLESRC